MRSARISTAMASCKKHLDGTGSRGTEIESFLVGYLLALIAAEFEMRLEAIVNARTARPGDAPVANFAQVAADRLIRSIKLKEIAGLLGHFDGGCKAQFNANIAPGTPPQVAYDNIMNNRHAVAHSTGSQMTFAELEAAIADAESVLLEAAKAIGLTAAEIAKIS